MLTAKPYKCTHANAFAHTKKRRLCKLQNKNTQTHPHYPPKPTCPHRTAELQISHDWQWNAISLHKFTLTQLNNQLIAKVCPLKKSTVTNLVSPPIPSLVGFFAKITISIITNLSKKNCNEHEFWIFFVRHTLKVQKNTLNYLDRIQSQGSQCNHQEDIFTRLTNNELNSHKVIFL